MTVRDRLTLNGTTYCLGTAGSFIRVCPVCGHERFRGSPDNTLEHCWDGHGPLEVLTTYNLERYKALWERLDDHEQEAKE